MQIATSIYIIVALIFAILIAVFQYYYKSKSRDKVSLMLTFFRSLSLFGLFLLIINPKIERIKTHDEKPILQVAIDNSLSIKKTNQTGEVLNLISDFKTNTVLNNKFDISYFSFGKQFSELDSLTFDEKQTDISKPLSFFSEVNKDQNSAVVLVTDGNQTFGKNYEFIKNLNPVFPVIVGDTTQYYDISITQLNVNRYAYLENKFPVEVYLNYTGVEAVKSEFSLFQGKTKVYSEVVNFNKVNNSKTLSFHLPATKVGTQFYKAKISKLANEKNTINNSHSFVVDVIDEQSKTLILASYRHPDLGSLKESIESNKQRNVVIKLVGETYDIGNFKNVILYQPTQDFKTTFEAIKKQKVNYAIITGTQTDWNFLNNVQSNFSRKTINQTENYQAVFNETFGTFSQTDIGFEEYPSLEDYFGEINVTASSETLLWQRISGFSTKKPLWITYENDNIRSFTVFGEGLWRWRMLSKVTNKSYKTYDDFIGKMMQYLSSKGRLNRLTIEYNSLYRSNELLKINARFLDKNFQFDPNANLWLHVENTKTSENKKVPFSLVGNSYSVELTDLVSGDYGFSVNVDNSVLKRKGTFKLVDFDVEQQFSSANLKSMTAIAEASDASLYFLNNTDPLIERLINDQRFVTIQKSQKKSNSLIDWQWLFILIILSLTIEWFVRKYNGYI